MRSRSLILLAFTLGACAAPAAAPSAPATPTFSASPTASTTPAAASATPTASPTAATGGTYVNYPLGFSIQIPGPWRRAECLSSRDYSALPAGDSFVRVPEQEERLSDTGYAFAAVSVSVEANPTRMPVRDWIARSGLGSSPGQTIEDARLDGRDAVVVRPTAALAVAYVVPVADRMYVVGYHNAPNDESQGPAMERMTGTFHVLTSQEQAAAPSYPPPVPRSAEAVANVLGDGFARADAVLLGTVMDPCMSSGAENAGASATPRNVFITELADAFAKGLRVSVTRAPLESDTFGTFVRATWTQPGIETQRRDLYMQRSGDVWTWKLVLARQ